MLSHVVETSYTALQCHTRPNAGHTHTHCAPGAIIHTQNKQLCGEASRPAPLPTPVLFGPAAQRPDSELSPEFSRDAHCPGNPE